MPQITFNVNNNPVSIDAENDDELLYLLRDRLGITGPKYGCGVGVCGACTIFKDGELARPCIVPMEEVEGASLTTIEGLAVDDILHPVQALVTITVLIIIWSLCRMTKIYIWIVLAKELLDQKTLLTKLKAQEYFL